MDTYLRNDWKPSETSNKVGVFTTKPKLMVLSNEQELIQLQLNSQSYKHKSKQNEEKVFKSMNEPHHEKVSFVYTKTKMQTSLAITA